MTDACNVAGESLLARVLSPPQAGSPSVPSLHWLCFTVVATASCCCYPPFIPFQALMGHVFVALPQARLG